jgi:GxxExxY protein
MERIVEILNEAALHLDTMLGYPEKCYQNYLMARFRQEDKHNFEVNQEVKISYNANGIRFGYGRIDLVVKTEIMHVLIELKANVQTHEKSLNQLRRYLAHYKNNKVEKIVGILVMYNTEVPVEITVLD